MKLEDCKIGVKVKVLGKTIHGTDDHYPALQRGWGYIRNTTLVCNEETVYLQETPGGQREDGGYSPNDLEPYTEPEETKYRQLKDITPRAIFQYRAETTLAFMQKFIRFVSFFSLEYEEVLSFDNLLFELEVSPDLADLLIQHGFIEKVVEKPIGVYSIGDRFRLEETNRDEYILAAIGGSRTIALISLVNGNTWSGNIQVASVGRITKAEFKQLTSSGKFTKIEGK